MITVGTSAATNLPVQTVQRALQRGATVIDINPGPESPFGEAAERRGGAWWEELQPQAHFQSCRFGLKHTKLSVLDSVVPRKLGIILRTLF